MEKAKEYEEREKTWLPEHGSIFFICL